MKKLFTAILLIVSLTASAQTAYNLNYGAVRTGIDSLSTFNLRGKLLLNNYNYINGGFLYKNSSGWVQNKLLTVSDVSGLQAALNLKLNISDYSGGGSTYTAGRGLTLTGTEFKLDTTKNYKFLNNLSLANTYSVEIEGNSPSRKARMTNVASVDSLANAWFTPAGTTGNRAFSLDVNFRGKGRLFAGDSTRAQLILMNTDYENTPVNQNEFLTIRSTGVNGYGIASRVESGSARNRPIYINATGGQNKASANVVFNTDRTSTFTGADGGGLVLGSWNSTYGGLWSSAVTKSQTNYTLLAGATRTYINAPTDVRFYVNDTNLAMGYTSAGVHVGPTAITPTAYLHLDAGATSKAPLKLTAGTNLSTPQAGAVEFDGSKFYVTIGSTRYQLALIGTTAPASATAAGIPNEIRVTSDYIYTCISTNTWVRSAAATW
jgi:hypothetical protein